jgi:hypothetical protein
VNGVSIVLTTGDFVFDHHIYEGCRHHFSDGVSNGVHVEPQLGGAALVHQLLDCLFVPTKGAYVAQLAVKEPEDEKEVDDSQRAYAFWRPFPRNESRDKQFWRVSEAMGFGSAVRGERGHAWERADYSSSPNVIVLSEGGMGFRHAESCWSRLPLDEARWIVLKTAAPIAEGELWNRLSTNYPSKLIVVVAVQELRKSLARLSTGLSWDETLGCIFNELNPRGALSELTKCQHLIVTFGSDGALWLDMSITSHRDVACRTACLVYDPPSVEGEDANGVEGFAFGKVSCLTAAVAWEISRNPTAPDLATACERGLCATRDLHRKGHGPSLEKATGFPAARLAKVITNPNYRYSRARFAAPVDARLDDVWSLLHESLRKPEQPAYDLARLTVLRGPIALDNVPHLKIGKLLTVDRREIEALRTLIRLMRNYKHESASKPLSIGVFGSPGSGKSFAVKEIAGAICGPDAWLEFNLSQFASPDDLIGAFHQIRDKVLQQKLPVVFFDEFDSQNYRWLQYLLAPMQDGKFQEGQITHPIGKCIFVFAGGTSWSFETFGPPKTDTNTITPEAVIQAAKHESDFRLAKGPDFKSRLDGFLNVVGPNQRQTTDYAANRNKLSPDPTDIYFPIRRALMLRSELKCPRDLKLNIDEGVLNAILRTEEFRHGSRSLSKLMQPFQPYVAEALVRSLLPPVSQITMHTDAEAFLNLCNIPKSKAWSAAAMSGSEEMSSNDALTENDVKQIAVAINDSYEALQVRTGQKQIGQETKFESLTDFLKESNQAAARRMIRILELLNLRLEPGESTAPEREKLSSLFEFYLELMAEAEHDGWMQWHLDRDWRHGSLPDGKKDAEKKLHPCLLPYRQLEPVDQEKDRNTIRNYLDYAMTARKRIVFA